MKVKAANVKGTRDIDGHTLIKRNYIINIIKRHFENFCYHPVETPAFENSETLMGSYGNEGDRLIFKILNSGNYLNKVDQKLLSKRDIEELTPCISEKALRYDLTVPFSRYVATHTNNLTFPFKRYQIQPVWRADRPQKGRFREFHQCDADVVGAYSLWQEVELIQLYEAVFLELGLKPVIKFNNRKLLVGLCEYLDIVDRFTEFAVCLDKLDKIGQEGVYLEFEKLGFSSSIIKNIKSVLDKMNSDNQSLAHLSNYLKDSVIGREGLDEIQFVIDTISRFPLKNASLKFDITLARGLNYYTGCIFEVNIPKLDIGSVGGGGRYDNLTERFGLKNMSGVGISFGLDRLAIVLEENDLYPKQLNLKKEVLFLNFGDDESKYAMQYIEKLRIKNIPSQLYPTQDKIKKQLNYANKSQIPYVIMMGETEIDNQCFLLKNMITGKQEKRSLAELATHLDDIFSS